MEALTWIAIAVIVVVAAICVYMWRHKTNKGSEKTGKNGSIKNGIAM